MKTNKLAQFALMTVLGIWGMVSACLICSEDNVNNPASLSDFLVIKLIGFVSLASLIYVGKLLYRRGLLSDGKPSDDK